MQLSQATVDAFQQHVLAEYPKEACGLVVNDEFIACENTAEQPKTTFRIDATEVARISAERGPITCYLHSHPYDSTKPPKYPAEWPSELDMERWIRGTTAWGIVGTDGAGITPFVWLDDAEIAPLKGRTFVSGAADCYTLIRDWYRTERGTTLKNYPRGMEWWNQGRDLYDEHFEDAGFVDVSDKPAEIGDVVMFRLASNFRNHAGVITGPNTLLHHMIKRVSAEEPLNRWRRQIARRVRYQGAA